MLTLGQKDIQKTVQNNIASYSMRKNMFGLPCKRFVGLPVIHVQVNRATYSL